MLKEKVISFILFGNNTNIFILFESKWVSITTVKEVINVTKKGLYCSRWLGNKRTNVDGCLYLTVKVTALYIEGS